MGDVDFAAFMADNDSMPIQKKRMPISFFFVSPIIHIHCDHKEVYRISAERRWEMLTLLPSWLRLIPCPFRKTHKRRWLRYMIDSLLFFYFSFVFGNKIDVSNAVTSTYFEFGKRKQCCHVDDVYIYIYKWISSSGSA